MRWFSFDVTSRSHFIIKFLLDNLKFNLLFFYKNCRVLKGLVITLPKLKAWGWYIECYDVRSWTEYTLKCGSKGVVKESGFQYCMTIYTKNIGHVWDGEFHPCPNPINQPPAKTSGNVALNEVAN